MKRNWIFLFLILWVSFSDVMSQKKEDPIWGAIITKNLEMLKDAIKSGSDVNGKTNFIFTRFPGSFITMEKASPLIYAIQNDWYEGTLELLRAGAKPNAEAKVTKLTNFSIGGCQVGAFETDPSPMFFAVGLNDLDVIKILIIAGADTRGVTVVKFPNACRSYGNQKSGMVYLREYAYDQAKEILKDGKKAAWAANGLPEEGQRPQ
jgi:hypothetical protein